MGGLEGGDNFSPHLTRREKRATLSAPPAERVPAATSVKENGARGWRSLSALGGGEGQGELGKRILDLAIFSDVMPGLVPGIHSTSPLACTATGSRDPGLQASPEGTREWRTIGIKRLD